MKRLAAIALLLPIVWLFALPVPPIQHSPWTTTTNDPTVTLQAQQPVSITTTNSIALIANGLISSTNTINAYVNVKSQGFGAVGNGSTDDTAAFQTAISVANGTPILVPEGTYKITSTLSDGGKVLNLIGAGSTRSYLLFTTTNDAIRISGSRAIVKDLGILYYGTGAGLGNAITIGYNLGYAVNCWLQGLYISNAPNYGIYWNEGPYLNVHNVDIVQPWSHGVYCSTNGIDNHHGNFSNVEVESSHAGYGYFLEGLSEGIGVSASAFLDCKSYYNTNGGFYVGGKMNFLVGYSEGASVIGCDAITFGPNAQGNVFYLIGEFSDGAHINWGNQTSQNEVHFWHNFGQNMQNIMRAWQVELRPPTFSGGRLLFDSDATLTNHWTVRPNGTDTNSYLHFSKDTNGQPFTITFTNITLSLSNCPVSINSSALTGTNLVANIHTVSGLIDHGDMIRVRGASDAPTAGAGLELQYFSGSGSILAQDRTAGHYTPLLVNGSDVTINGNSGGNVGIGMTATAKLDVNGTARVGGATVIGSGEGLEMQYFGGEGKLMSYDRAGNVWKSTFITGSAVRLGAYNAYDLTLDSGHNATLTGTLIVNDAVPLSLVSNTAPVDASTIKRWIAITNASDGQVYKMPLYQ